MSTNKIGYNELKVLDIIEGTDLIRVEIKHVVCIKHKDQLQLPRYGIDPELLKRATRKDREEEKKS